MKIVGVVAMCAAVNDTADPPQSKVSRWAVSVSRPPPTERFSGRDVWQASLATWRLAGLHLVPSKVVPSNSSDQTRPQVGGDGGVVGGGAVVRGGVVVVRTVGVGVGVGVGVALGVGVVIPTVRVPDGVWLGSAA